MRPTVHNRYSSDPCDAVFSKKSNLVTHIRTQTGERPYACDQCDAAFSKKSNLVTHIRTHTGERPYACDKCDAAFSDKSSLIKHIRTHTGEKPYACDQCDAAFSIKCTLIRHIRTHTGEKPYTCDQCDAAFSTQGYLTTHIRTHTGEKPYTCDQCDAAFSALYPLTIHKRKHTGEKPYACDQCDAAFSQKHHLAKHIRTHTGEKPYACDQCDAAFSVNHSLTVHRRTHTGEKPYKCHIPDCNKRFTASGQRDQHEKYFHDKQRQETYTKKKEEWIFKLFQDHNIAFEREVTISYRSCGETDTWARLDFVVYRPHEVVIVSVDEFQHYDYDIVCEVARMSKVVTAIRAAGDERSIVWLRFNPDYFHVDGVKHSICIQERGLRLVQTINQSRPLVPHTVSVTYLYYDSTTCEDGSRRPEILGSPDYSRQWSTLVGPTIVT